MNSRESLKFMLENFSTEREFSFVYKEKAQIIIKNHENSNDYGYIYYFDENSYDYYFEGKLIDDLLHKIFKENEIESSVKQINELISKNSFSIAIKIKTPPTADIFQTVAKILLEKVAHIEDDHFRTFRYDNLSEADEKRLLKAHNYSKIFCRYVDDISYHTQTLSKDYADSLLGKCFSEKYGVVDSRIEHIKAEMTFSPTTSYSYALYIILRNPLLEQLTANNIPIFVEYNKSLSCMYLAKKLCPILLEIGDIENALKLFTLIDYDYKDTNHLVPIIEWCLKNDLSSIEKPLAILTKLEPHHPLIKDALLHLEKVKLMNSTGFTLTDINTLSGIDFELLVINGLKKYTNFTTVESTSKTGDYGADIIVTSNSGTRIAIQCKRFAQKVNLKAVQEITAALAHYHADVGIVISNNGFLNSAINLAKSNDIELWDSEKLLRLLAGESDFSVIFEL